MSDYVTEYWSKDLPESMPAAEKAAWAENARRTEVIRQIRQLADWLDEHPEMPAPNSVRAQYSVAAEMPGANKRALVRKAARDLGVEPRCWAESMAAFKQFDDDDKPGLFVQYTVHASVGVAPPTVPSDPQCACSAHTTGGEPS